ncbi:unnamed protein product [Ascophyllum nodosum]
MRRDIYARPLAGGTRRPIAVAVRSSRQRSITTSPCCLTLASLVLATGGNACHGRSNLALQPYLPSFVRWDTGRRSGFVLQRRKLRCTACASP